MQSLPPKQRVRHYRHETKLGRLLPEIVEDMAIPSYYGLWCLLFGGSAKYIMGTAASPYGGLRDCFVKV